MFNKEALDIVLSHSETMIAEWVENDGMGYRIINLALQNFYDGKIEGHRGCTNNSAVMVTASVKSFVMQDMAMWGW